jgi:hypothetical protein
LDALPFEAVRPIGGAGAGGAVRATDVAVDAGPATALLSRRAAGRIVGAARLLADAGLAAALLSWGTAGLVLGAAPAARARRAFVVSGQVAEAFTARRIDPAIGADRLTAFARVADRAIADVIAALLIRAAPAAE